MCEDEKAQGDEEIAAEEARDQRLRDQLQGLPLSNHFRVRIIFNPGGEDADFTLGERRSIRSTMLQAAQRIENAYTALNDEWTQITRSFRFEDLGHGGGRRQNQIWQLINDNRENFLDKLRRAVVALTCSDGRYRSIWVSDRRDETHEERNPMYTHYVWLFGWQATSLRLRSHYWDLVDDGGHGRVKWTIHEIGRYFLHLEDQERVGGYRAPEAVQTWDEYVGWLADCHLELIPPPF